MSARAIRRPILRYASMLLEGRVLAGAHAATEPSGAAVLLASQAVILDRNGLVRWRGAADEARIDDWRQGRVYFN